MRKGWFLLLLMVTGALSAKPASYWICTDDKGRLSAQDRPCVAAQQLVNAPPGETTAPAKPASSLEAQRSKPPAARTELPPPRQRATPKLDLWPILRPLIGLGIFMVVAVLTLQLLFGGGLRAARRRHGRRTKEATPSTGADPWPSVHASVRQARIEPSATALPRPSEWSHTLIRTIEWKRFEELCCGYWRAKGYRAELTAAGADGGIDLRLYSPSDPGKILAVVQCKSRVKEPVGVSTVRELFGVMNHIAAPMGVLMTSSGFTPDAQEFSRGKHLQLLDGSKLLELIRTLNTEEQAKLLSHVTRDDYLTPTCPACDIKMVRRTPLKGGKPFWGCPNFPRCRHRFDLEVGVKSSLRF